MSFRAEFRHPLVGWRNAVEEPALGRSREAGFSTSQNCPRAGNLASLDCITTLAGSRRDTLVAANTTKAHREGANVMLIIGCDFHPSFQQVAIFDKQTGEYQEKRLGHRAEAEQYYRSLAGQRVRVGMEACGHYPWFERLLADWEWSCGWGMRQKSAPRWCASRKRTGAMRSRCKC